MLVTDCREKLDDVMCRLQPYSLRVLAKAHQRLTGVALRGRPSEKHRELIAGKIAGGEVLEDAFVKAIESISLEDSVAAKEGRLGSMHPEDYCNTSEAEIGTEDASELQQTNAHETIDIKAFVAVMRSKARAFERARTRMRVSVDRIVLADKDIRCRVQKPANMVVDPKVPFIGDLLLQFRAAQRAFGKASDRLEQARTELIQTIVALHTAIKDDPSGDAMLRSLAAEGEHETHKKSENTTVPEV